MDVIGSALKVLIEKGELDRKEEPELFELIINDIGFFNDLESLCNKLGLYFNQKFGVFYVSPIPGTKTFGYSNDELRKVLYYSFNNEDMYLVLFIIATIVTEFFPEANEVPAIAFLKFNKLMDILDNKINVLKDQVNLEEISYENSYNFEVVVKKWIELPRARVDKTDADTMKENGKKSKIQIVNTTLKFLLAQELIKIADFGNDKSIYVTERFKATVFNTFNNEDIQSEIYSFIDNLKNEEEADQYEDYTSVK